MENSLGEFSISDPNLLSRKNFRENYYELLEKLILTEAPVPEHLRDRFKEISSIRQLKLSQKMGILLFLQKKGSQNQSVKERLFRFQEIASLEAIISAEQFSNRIIQEPKLQRDFRHVILFYLSSNYSYSERKRDHKNRIRGYRDKGTLPDLNLRARNRAQEGNFLNMLAMERETELFLRENLPESVFEGDYLDLCEALEFLSEEEEILKRLRVILLSKI